MISWSDIRDLGKYCPNLEVLKLPAVLHRIGDITTLPWDANFSDMTLLPRLRECVIHRVVPFSWAPPIIFYSSDIEYVIGWLFRGMPALETFTFWPWSHVGQIGPRKSDIGSSTSRNSVRAEELPFFAPQAASKGLSSYQEGLHVALFLHRST